MADKSKWMQELALGFDNFYNLKTEVGFERKVDIVNYKAYLDSFCEVINN